MCLDPRPESLVRVRPSPTHALSPIGPMRSSMPGAVVNGVPDDRWVAALADSLDARGWTLVTRSAAC